MFYEILWDGCGSLGQPQVLRAGNWIDIRQPVYMICGLPIGESVRYSLGRLEAGAYSVHFAPCQQIVPGECWAVSSPADLTFSVLAPLGAAEAVPVLSLVGLCALAGLLAMLGIRRIRGAVSSHG